MVYNTTLFPDAEMLEYISQHLVSGDFSAHDLS